MMFKAMFVLALASAPAIAPVPQWANGTMNSDWPPTKYEGEAMAVIALVDDVSQICGSVPPPYRVMACASKEKGIIVMPNPCAAEYRQEMFAKILCHEKAHINGWNATHDN